MKHSKHSKGFGGNNNNENNGDYIFNLYTEFESGDENTDPAQINSSRKKGKNKGDDVILSSTPKGKKFYNVLVKILFIISILGLGAIIGYAAYEGYLGMPLVFIPVVLNNFNKHKIILPCEYTVVPTYPLYRNSAKKASLSLAFSVFFFCFLA